MAEQSSGAVIRRNVIFNIVGGLAIAAVNILAIPVQIRVLGAETYGLIGFVTASLVVVYLLEFGLLTTMVRELARDSTPDRSESRDIVQTAIAVYWLISALIAIGFIAGADWITTRWLTLQTMDAGYAAASLRLLAISQFLTWPFNIYSGVLAGLQRLDTAVAIRLVYAMLSAGGGALILLTGIGFTPFIYYQIGVSGLIIIVEIIIASRLLPPGFLMPRISLEAFRRVRRFSLDVYGISALGIIFTFADRVLISAVLPLAELGYYNLAYNAARLIGLMQEFINGAVMPSLSKDYAAGDLSLVEWRYGKFAQIVTYITALPAAGLMVWGRDALGLLTTPLAAERAAPVLAVLAAGFWLSASLSPAQTLVVVAGKPRIQLIASAAGLAIYLPALVVLVLNWGLIGAAAAMVLLNVFFYIVFYPQARGLLPNPQRIRWIVRDALPFILVALAVMWVAHAIVQTQPITVLVIVGVVASGVYSALGFLMLSPSTRDEIRRAAVSILPRASHG